MSQCKVYLENYSGVYYAGSEIRGRLECFFDDVTSVRGIKVRFKCREYNSWSGTESYTDPVDHKSKTRHITLTGDNTIMYAESMLFGSDSGNTELPRGRHVYPFSFQLPHDIPSTFNGPHGNISYKVKAIVDRPMRIDYEDDFIFVVQSPIDFNKSSRDLQDITTYSDEKSVCCWCCKGGDITMDVELPKIAFIAGETIPFKVSITNLSNSNVENLKVKLRKTITYQVTSPKFETKDDVEDIFSIVEHGVGAHGEHTYHLQLAIPGYIEVPNFAKCELFRVSYELKVTAEMPSCTLDLDVSAWDIVLGHVQCAAYGQGDARPMVPVPGEAYPDIAYPPPAAPYPPTAGFVPTPDKYPPPYPPPNSKEPSAAPPAFGYPVYPPSAPSSSIASAPSEDNAKGREAAGYNPNQYNSTPNQPPPSYSQAQQNVNKPPYPPQ